MYKWKVWMKCEIFIFILFLFVFNDLSEDGFNYFRLKEKW